MDTEFIEQVARDFLAYLGLLHTDSLIHTFESHEDLALRAFAGFAEETGIAHVIPMDRVILGHICGHQTSSAEAA